MPLNVEQKIEIQRARERQEPTRRATVPDMEAILYEAFPVLDHGFVRVVDYMGDDAAVVQAARVSYGSGTRKISDDRGLIRYLMRHHHSTPFEMCEIKLHVKLPIFVARQWVRHRTANINEYSARYSVLDKEFYIPDEQYLKTVKKIGKKIEKKNSNQADMFNAVTIKEVAAQSSQNKQGRDELLSDEEAAEASHTIKRESARAYTTYSNLLNESDDEERKGLARELARIVLPTNIYTQWYWKIDLHNLLHFVRLRADPHAQYEIRVYAEKIAEIIKKWVPHTFDAFAEYQAGAAQISASGLGAIRRLIAGENVTAETSGMSKREWRELMAVLGREDA